MSDRKEMETSLARLKNLKNTLNQVYTALADTLLAIEAGSPWGYAKFEVPVFMQLKAAVDDCKNVSPFWSSWSLNAEFKRWAVDIRKTHSPAMVKHEAKHADVLDQRLQDLELHVRRVHASHDARMNVA